MQIFNVDMTFLENFRWIILIRLRAKHHLNKASTLTEIIQVLRRNPSFFSKTQIWYRSRNLTISVHSTDEKHSNSAPDTSVKTDIINWRKCENVQFQRFECMIFLPYLNLDENKKSLSESKNHDGQHLNVSPTMPKTKSNSESRGLEQTRIRRDNSGFPHSVRHLTHNWASPKS